MVQGCKDAGLLRVEVFDGLVKSPGCGGGGRRLEFECQPPCALFEHKVKLHPGRGAVMARLPSRVGLKHLFQRKALPGCAEDRVAAKVVLGFQAQQGVEQPAVPHIDFRV